MLRLTHTFHRLRSAWAYRRFQARIRREREAARSMHKPTRDINARQSAILHASLGAGR